jgi:hypothetical protein
MFDLEKVKNLLKTGPNTAYFWSGLGEEGATIAENIAKKNDGTTLEMIMKKYKQELVDAGFPYDSEYDRFIWDDADSLNKKAWSDISEAYASQTSGNVRVVLGDQVRETSVWINSEMPRLLREADVSSINGIPRNELSSLYNELGNNPTLKIHFSNAIRSADINNTNANFLDSIIVGLDADGKITNIEISIIFIVSVDLSGQLKK